MNSLLPKYFICVLTVDGAEGGQPPATDGGSPPANNDTGAATAIHSPSADATRQQARPQGTTLPPAFPPFMVPPPPFGFMPPPFGAVPPFGKLLATVLYFLMSGHTCMKQYSDVFLVHLSINRLI